MPIYEYYCQRCEKNFEKLVHLGRRQEVCPHCGVLAEKTISKVAAIDSCAPKKSSGFG